MGHSVGYTIRHTPPPTCSFGILHTYPLGHHAIVEQHATGHFVKVLVCWAILVKGEPITYSIVSLITPPPLHNGGILGLHIYGAIRCLLLIPGSPQFFTTIYGDPGRMFYRILDARKFTFL